MDTVSYAGLDVRENRPRLRNGPETKVLAGCKDGATAVCESTASTIADARDSNILLEITPPMLHEIASLPPARMVKIFEVRYKLAQGTYDLDERLDAVLDRILTDINT
jgi:hypothetical protein